MNKKKVLVTLITVLVVAVLAYLGYQLLNQETLEEKLSEASFVKSGDKYVRDVIQDEITYGETLSTADNIFMRMTNNDGEIEAYSYNYEDDTFTYLYYFDEELILSSTYDYDSEEIISDEGNVHDSLVNDIEDLKNYFNSILEEYDIEIEEL